MHDETHMGATDSGMVGGGGVWQAGCLVSHQELSQLEVCGSQLQELPVRLLDLPTDLHLLVRKL